MQRRLSDSRNKVGEIFYTPRGKIRIVQILEIHEGYDDKQGYIDENGNTLVCWDFIDQEVVELNSRSRLTDIFIHDMGGKSSGAHDVLKFDDRHAYFIVKLFEDWG